MSFRSYLRRTRLRHALELLAATDISIGEVAVRVGYREASQFTKAFKRTYGVTPSEARARRRGSPPPG